MNMKELQEAVNALSDADFASFQRFVKNNSEYRGESKLFILKTGDRVFWVSTKKKNRFQLKMVGTVQEVMRKYVKVKLDDSSMWRVHPSFLQMETK